MTSKPSSPVKLTRASRVGTPQTKPSRTLKCGNAAWERSTPVDQRRDDVARLRAVDRDRRELLGDGGEARLQIGPFGLQIVLHHRCDMRGARSRRRDVEAVFGQPHDDAVVIDEAHLVQHQPIAAAPDAELGERIDVEPVEKFRRVGSDDLDLAERRGVHDARRGPGARHSRLIVSALLSPGSGTREARFQRPDSSNTAPRATNQECSGVSRTGSNMSRRARPPNRPKVTGV